jgi:hypothetical protein
MTRRESGHLRMFLAIVASVLLATAFALADDFAPPPWRGLNGTTFQQWKFGTDQRGPILLPESGFNNEHGIPVSRVNTLADWEPALDGREGVWPLMGEIDFLVPNRPQSEPDSYKEIWFQLTWKEAGLDPFLWEQPFVGLATHPACDKYEVIPRDISKDENGWTNTLFKINVWPNPYEEMITLKGDIYVDQVVIDTCCIPEPATIILFGMGSILMSVRRKKHV